MKNEVVVKKVFFSILALILPIKCFAEDTPSQALFIPTINIDPQDEQKYPSSLKVKILISETGSVMNIDYPPDIPKYITMKANILKQAKFSPYLKNGIAVKSIAPFSVKFYKMTDEEMHGNED